MVFGFLYFVQKLGFWTGGIRLCLCFWFADFAGLAALPFEAEGD
jgi:hypothetical protein